MKDLSKWLGFDKQETTGSVLQIRLVELLIAVQVIIYSWSWGAYIRHYSGPAVPVGIARQLNLTFLYHHQISLINAGLITVLILAGFFRKGKWTYFIALLLMHLQYAARFSQGKIGHGSVLTGLMLLSLALGFILFDDGQDQRKMAAGLMIFFIGMAYDLAAFSKLIADGFFWPGGNHLWLWIHERAIDLMSQHGSFAYNRLQQLVLNHYWLATAFLLSGWIIEFCGITFWFSKSRPYITTLLIMMHIGILLIMNIDFSPFFEILILLGYPWDRLFDTLITKGTLRWFNRFEAVLLFPLSVHRI